MGKRGPRNSSLSVLPGEVQIVDVRERPPVPWDRMVLKEEQAAEFLKCSPQTLRKRASSGEIPRYRVGGEWRYYVYDLLDYTLAKKAQ